MADVKQDPALPAGIKIFVGNLSFNVDKDGLEKHFAQAGKVLSANVITRGNRSRGYGFVEMATLPEAEEAVKLFHRKEIDGRQVNVELARPRAESSEPSQEGEGSSRRGRGRGGRGRGGRGGDRGGGDRGGGDRGGERGRGGRGGRGRGGRGRAYSAEGEAPDKEAVHDENRPARRVNNFRRRQNRDPSADTLFVANLSFALKDEDLSDLFKEFKPVEAHVVVGRSGRSKGFGFVKFQNSADQNAALNKLDKVESSGRVLTVKIALNPEPVQEGEPSNDQKAKE
jgi:RNA recognition motif-containing protein